ncbi:hypothetical protein QBC40DRAFT_84080 [Triangularia verruculosa]|uniref:Uncharacterized protein n=1 Tax=Triangularia verruculosa TaxID=2587418 RepID=A0AAN6XQP0_9PEZI|nr:hypothetical protein QBC40DRAFT_84080 [Triangularia verruculosa]
MASSGGSSAKGRAKFSIDDEEGREQSSEPRDCTEVLLDSRSAGHSFLRSQLSAIGSSHDLPLQRHELKPVGGKPTGKLRSLYQHLKPALTAQPPSASNSGHSALDSTVKADGSLPSLFPDSSDPTVFQEFSEFFGNILIEHTGALSWLREDHIRFNDESSAKNAGFIGSFLRYYASQGFEQPLFIVANLVRLSANQISDHFLARVYTGRQPPERHALPFSPALLILSMAS